MISELKIPLTPSYWVSLKYKMTGMEMKDFFVFQLYEGHRTRANGRSKEELEVLNRPAEEFDNDQSLEFLWASKAYEHNVVYFNLLCSVDPKLLKITPIDDLIYKLFREEFPTMDVKVIDESHLKSTKEKEKWRPFCERFKNVLEDYSFGTLLRAKAEEDNREENTILVTRIQFCCIEIARNREGVNDILRSKFRLTNVENDDQKMKNDVETS